MKNHTTLLAFIAVAFISFLIGSNVASEPAENSAVPAVTTIETAAKNHPRGSLNIPAQWFMMESLVGWEKMILIFGYADNVETCLHLLDIAKIESPGRSFRCENAN